MDHIGASALSLRYVHEQQEDEEEKFENLITSTKSLSAYESDSIKCLVPQFIASLVVSSFNFGVGISMAYSAILISQLEKPDSDFKATNSENAFMASIIVMVAPFVSVINGLFMDKIGRIKTIKYAVIPGILGWTVVALAPNMKIVILGRILCGISSCWGANPSLVYISEIAHPKVRLSLMQLYLISVSLGMIVTYLGGEYVSWRLIAWISNIFIVLPVIALFFVHESPVWLIFKGKYTEAQKSLNWFYKYQPVPSGKGESFAELQFKVLKKQQEEAALKKKTEGAFKDIIKEFRKPTGYKPLIIMCPLFFCQHFSGIFITMFYSITFIQEAGTNFNAYIASAMIGVIRLVMSILNVFILTYVDRRKAIMFSCLGMAVFMFTSGLYTQWIKEGVTTEKWVPVVSLLMYVVCSVVGMMFLPFTIISELFPLEIRGIGYTVAYSLATIFQFSALQSYYWLNEILGGATNLQWFFAVVSIAGMVYTYMFLPETRGKKLSEISDNFKEGWLYIGKSHKNNVRPRTTTA